MRHLAQLAFLARAPLAPLLSPPTPRRQTQLYLLRFPRRPRHAPSRRRPPDLPGERFYRGGLTFRTTAKRRIFPPRKERSGGAGPHPRLIGSHACALEGGEIFQSAAGQGRRDAFEATHVRNHRCERRRHASGAPQRFARPASSRISRASSASSEETTSFTPPTALLSHGWTPTRPASRTSASIPLLSRSSRAISASVGSVNVATTSGLPGMPGS